MVTDEEISEALQCILKQKQEQNLCSDEFVNGVVEELQSKLNVDLSSKVVFIRSQIQQQQQQQHEDDNFALLHTPNFHPLPSSSEQQPKADDNTPTENVVVSVPKESTQTKGKRRGGPGGLNKLCGVSPLLQTIVGQPAPPRTEIVKQLWAYIRKHNLQDPSNKRKIICNDELRLVFETDCTDMFKMNKLLAKHIIPLEATKESAPKKVKVENESGTQSAESGPSVKISEALGNFFGVAEREMLQSEVLRRIWEYIKLNGLEDPANSMVIICDTKLQELFGCKNISALGIPQVLAQHHILSRS